MNYAKYYVVIYYGNMLACMFGYTDIKDCREHIKHAMNEGRAIYFEEHYEIIQITRLGREVIESYD